MSATTFAREHPVGTAGLGFALGAVTALLAVAGFGTPWKREPVIVEVERVVERVFEKPAAQPAAKPTRRGCDLVVMQKGQQLAILSEFSEYFVEATRALPEVESVSEVVVGGANVHRGGGDLVDPDTILVQGWKPDNFGYEDIETVEGRRLVAGDRHKVLIGRILAENLKEKGNVGHKVGDTLRFLGDPENLYEIVGIFRSKVVFEEGAAIIPFRDAQALRDLSRRVTGFSVRLKKVSPDSAAEVDAVKRKIEDLRDPKDPTVRLIAYPPDTLHNR